MNSLREKETQFLPARIVLLFGNGNGIEQTTQKEQTHIGGRIIFCSAGQIFSLSEVFEKHGHGFSCPWDLDDAVYVVG